MCWIGSKQTRKILEEPLTVYKIVKTKKGQPISLFWDFPYIFGMEYSTLITIEKSFLNSIHIAQGYHSYSSKEFATKGIILPEETIIECEIPVGAIVYGPNTTFEMVSNKLIVKGYVE